jgi:hypothetical protein
LAKKEEIERIIENVSKWKTGFGKD